MQRWTALACSSAAALSLTLAAPCAAGARSARHYVATRAETFVSQVVAIDAGGDLAYTTYLGGEYAAYVETAKGTIRSLDAPEAGQVFYFGTLVTDLSNRGRAAGYYNALLESDTESDDPAAHDRALVWSKSGVVTTLSTPQDQDSRAEAINDTGSAVGEITDAHGPRAVLWRKGKVRYLGPHGSAAVDVNDHGRIVGTIGADAAESKAVVFDGRGGYRTLGLLRGASASSVTGLASSGAAVGTTTIKGKAVPTFWSARGKAYRLKGSGAPAGVNRHNIVVGAGGASGNAVVWRGVHAKQRALPDLARPAGSVGPANYQATDVNDRGRIAGISFVPAGDPVTGGPGRDSYTAVIWKRVR